MAVWRYLADKWQTIELRARYARLVHEQLIGLTEGGGQQPVSEEPGRWLLAGDSSRLGDEPGRADLRNDARRLVAGNPHARNILRLLEAYVTGPGLSLSLRPVQRTSAATLKDQAMAGDSLAAAALQLWQQFLEANARHYSHREHARRAWRDGECFVRRFEQAAWPPAVRFLDPETIGATQDAPDSQGILTAEGDVETPLWYLHVDPTTGRLVERISAADMLHTRLGVDSNQKRGVTIFSAVIRTLESFEKWVETELLARKLQSSIVLWRKVQGSPQQVAATADATAGGRASGVGRHERFQPGTIITTNQGTDIQFLQPNTNFGDAVPLGRTLLLCAAAGAGLPEFMLTSDASNANFASTMVAEGPAVKQFQTEQLFFAAEFTRLWRWVMDDAIRLGLLPAEFFDLVEPQWTFPQLVNRDRPRERLADVRLVEQGILSRAEVARRDGVDPRVMRSELSGERGAE